MTFQSHLDEDATTKQVGPFTNEQLLAADRARNEIKRADPYGERQAARIHSAEVNHYRQQDALWGRLW